MASKQMTVRLSEESTAFLDQKVKEGVVASRAAGLDKMVKREMRRARAVNDALIYARTGEDPELTGFHEAALSSLRAEDLDG